MFTSSSALKDNPLVLTDVGVQSQQRNTAARRTSNIPKPPIVILDINLEVIEQSYCFKHIYCMRREE